MFKGGWWSGGKEKRTPSPARVSLGDLAKAEKIVSAYQRESPTEKEELSRSDSNNKFSSERLRTLYAQVTCEAAITDANSSDIVAALRSIAEILIWGDKNDPSVFETFLEKHMLAYFVSILRQCGEVFSKPLPDQVSAVAEPARTSSPVRSSASKVRGILSARNPAGDDKPTGVLSVGSAHHVCTQVLQLLHILFENISQDTSLYFLLSNNFINQIIGCVYDFADDEILAHYVSLMKILSAKLNPHTIHFFYAEDLIPKGEATDHEHLPFPLFTKALELFTHSETMVRIAARTVVLNVLRVRNLHFAGHSFVRNPEFPRQLIALLCKIMNGQAEQLRVCLAQEVVDGLVDFSPNKSSNVDDISLLRQKLVTVWNDKQKRTLPPSIVGLSGNQEPAGDELSRGDAQSVSVWILYSERLLPDRCVPVVNLFDRRFVRILSLFLSGDLRELDALLVYTTKRATLIPTGRTELTREMSTGYLVPFIGRFPNILQLRTDRIKDVIAEHESYLQYISDLVDLDVEPLKGALFQHFVPGFVLPAIVHLVSQGIPNLAHKEDVSDTRELSAAVLSALYLLNMAALNLSDLNFVFPQDGGNLLLDMLSRCLRLFDNSEVLPQDDRLPLLVLMLFTTIHGAMSAQKSVIPSFVLEFTQNKLWSLLVSFIHAVPQAGFVVCRPLALRLACGLLESIIQADVGYHIEDQDMAVLLDAKEQACLMLRRCFRNDNGFIGLVELEVYLHKQQKPVPVERLLEREFLAIFLFCPNPVSSNGPAYADSSGPVVTLSHSLTPRSNTDEKNFPDLCRRWPLTPDEECRYHLRVFLMLRRLSLRIQRSLTPSGGSFSSTLPDSSVRASGSNTSVDMPAPVQSVQVGDVVDISSCDTIISCQMIPFHTHMASKSTNRSPTSNLPVHRPPQMLLCPSDEEKWVKRFLIIHQWQMLFVEPDNRKVGFAVVKETFVLPSVQMVEHKEQRERIICCCSLALNANHRNHDVNALVGTEPKTMAKSVFLQVTQQLPLVLKNSASDAPWNLEPKYDACFRIMFDDSIRAMAATTRIRKNQERIRELKLEAISNMLDFPVGTGLSGSLPADDTRPASGRPSATGMPKSAENKPHAAHSHHAPRRQPIVIHGATASASRSQSQEKSSSSSKSSSRSTGRDRTASRPNREGKPPGPTIPMSVLDSGRSGFIERVEPD